MKKFDINKFASYPDVFEYCKSKTSFEETWNDCERGDWMLWTAAKLEIDDRLLTKAAALCANTVRHLAMDKRNSDTIDAALKYAYGKISRKKLNRYLKSAYHNAADYLAANADNAAVYAANAVVNADYAAFYAALAAFYAADATADAAYTAVYAADAYTATAVYVANTAADAAIAARQKNQQQTADICREILTDAVFEKIK